MNRDLLATMLKLSASDRLELIEALWDSLSDDDDIPITSEERAFLDERLADLVKNPDAQSSWPEVKARLEQRRR